MSVLHVDTIYHGSTVIVEKPEILVTKYNKDFYFGFYCTRLQEQAKRWATRHVSTNNIGFVNYFHYTPSSDLNIKVFEKMTDEWLDFIVACRNGTPHDYDIVEGPMADDAIYDYVQDFLDGRIDRETFWSLVKFKHPTHQISFHTDEALKTIKFIRGVKVHGNIR